MDTKTYESYVIQKVLALEDIKTHCFNCDVVLPERNVNLGNGPFYVNPVQVRDSSGNALGFAALSNSWANGIEILEAEVFLTRDTPERLDLEQSLRSYELVLPSGDRNISCVILRPAKALGHA